jgi:cysteine desulfurase/selenocysteine lyase
MKNISPDKILFDVEKIRKNFSTLNSKVNDKPLVYFDNAATTQKPESVINTLVQYYEEYNSNVHRGIHYLSNKASAEFENSRLKVKDFINAGFREEIVFTRGTTESINLLTYSYGDTFLNEGDEILISTMEHHSNIVPWQILCEKKKAKLKIIPITAKGEIIFDEYIKLLNEKVKIVSVAYISNSLGTINPVEEIINEAHKRNIKVVIDAAQAAPHLKIDVQKLNCDFLAFSGHKVFGPTGIGVLYGKKELLEAMPPFQGGGEMIKNVTFEKTIYNDLPYKFEAGTPDISGAIGLGAAIDYINSFERENIIEYENELLEYATEKLQRINGLKIFGNAQNKASLISFNLDGIHPTDTGMILDKLGIAVRTGHHCNQPLMDWYGIPGTVRASFCFYNIKEEIDILEKGIIQSIKMLR